MRVRQGWSGEISPNTWAKFDVELDEDDLDRMLRSFHPVLIGLDAAETLGHATSYQLLELEAEFLVTSKLIIRYGFNAVEGRRKLDELAARKRAILSPLVEQRKQLNAAAETE